MLVLGAHTLKFSPDGSAWLELGGLTCASARHGPDRSTRLFRRWVVERRRVAVLRKCLVFYTLCFVGVSAKFSRGMNRIVQ